MRLTRYLTEKTDHYIEDHYNEILNTIKTDCKPWLSEMSHLVYRGMKDIGPFAKKSVRTDRRPTDSSKYLHNLGDEVFKEEFGWKARSEGLFVAKYISQAMGYANIAGGGNIYTVFPIGSYKYIYSDEIADYFTIYDNPTLPLNNTYINSEDFEFDIKTDKQIKQAVINWLKRSYTDKGLDNSDFVVGEVMIKCKEYWALECQPKNPIFMRLINDLGMK